MKQSGLKRQYSVEKLAEAGFLSLESPRAASDEHFQLRGGTPW